MSTRVSPLDIENQEFSRKVRGVDADEVKLYLRSVAEEIERLNLENGRLTEEAGALKTQVDQLRSQEKTLQETLVSAQQMSGEIKERAQAEAELILKEARLEADKIVQQSKENLSRLETEVANCQLEKDLFEKRLLSTIEEHMTLLERRREADRRMDNVHVLPQRPGNSEVG